MPNRVEHGLSMRRFEFEQAAFPLEAPSVAPELSRGAERAMAWDDDRDRICAIGSADGATGARPSDTSRDFGVRAGLAAWYRAELLPYTPLKRGAADIERQFQYRREPGTSGVGLEILRDRSRPFTGNRVVTANRGFRIAGAKLGNDRAIRVAERGETKPVAGARDEQPAKRRVDYGIPDDCAAAVRSVRRLRSYRHHGSI